LRSNPAFCLGRKAAREPEFVSALFCPLEGEGLNFGHAEKVMAYMLFVAEPRGQRAERTEEEGKALYQRMLDYAEDLKARGVLRAYSSLRNDSEGQRLEMRGGKRSLRDGPFAETREMIGGFFLVDCATREEAVELAALCPAAEWATMEVRETGPCYLG
jgi:hypothetical protein